MVMFETVSALVRVSGILTPVGKPPMKTAAAPWSIGLVPPPRLH